VCRSKHVETSIDFGIINSITKLHLVGISTESSTMHESMNIKHVVKVLGNLSLITHYQLLASEESVKHKAISHVRGSRPIFCCSV
jgi:hypothetical protein